LQRILKEALLFQNNEKPTFSKIGKLIKAIRKYESEFETYILYSKRREKSEIINIKEFWHFISEVTGKETSSFLEISKILEIPQNRAESIQNSGNSKTHFTQVFHQTIFYKKRGEKPTLYKKDEVAELNNISEFVAVENGESFLNIEKVDGLKNFQHFIYLGGTGNILTREFLQNRKVLFFLDFDISSMNIFEDFKAKDKKLFTPPNLEFLLQNYGNAKLYLKQRTFLRQNYSINSKMVINFILKYSLVLEQEILHGET